MATKTTTKPKKTTASKSSQEVKTSTTDKTTVAKKSPTTNNQNQFMLLSLILVGVVLVLLFSSFSFYKISEIDEKVTKMDDFFTANAQGYGNSETQTQTGNQGDVQAPTVGEPDIDNRPVLGDANAPITIVEYSDFECPFCQRFFLETYPQLKTEYIDTGKVKLVYKDFPLDFHPMAKPSAIASKCVFTLADSETFFEYHDTIFINQNVLSDSNLRNWALNLGISGDEYDQCIVNPEIEAMVDADMNEGTQFGVSGTPSFVINGNLLVGAQPFSAFEQVIEAELE